MKKSIAIQMDNIEKIDYEFDTSFLIGYEAQERGYDIFYYNPKDLFIKENTIHASGYYLELLLDEKNYFNFKSNKTPFLNFVCKPSTGANVFIKFLSFCVQLSTISLVLSIDSSLYKIPIQKAG